VLQPNFSQPNFTISNPTTMQKLTFEVASFQRCSDRQHLRSGIRSELQELAENERNIRLGLQNLQMRRHICVMVYLPRPIEPAAPGARPGGSATFMLHRPGESLRLSYEVHRRSALLAPGQSGGRSGASPADAGHSASACSTHSNARPLLSQSRRRGRARVVLLPSCPIRGKGSQVPQPGTRNVRVADDPAQAANVPITASERNLFLKKALGQTTWRRSFGFGVFSQSSG
jgi:hypothetical protein